MTFHILTVCTGNICRSPMAEQLLRAGLARWSEVTVASAGTHALIGHAMTEQAQGLSLRLGGQRPEDHLARQLDAHHVRDADLVIALAREHRRGVVELLPRASRRTFTLREFARLVADVTDEDLAGAAALEVTDRQGRFAELVQVAASRRGLVVPPDNAADDDVDDPYRRDSTVYEASAAQVVPAVEAILGTFARAATIVQG